MRENGDPEVYSKGETILIKGVSKKTEEKVGQNPERNP